MDLKILDTEMYYWKKFCGGDKSALGAIYRKNYDLMYNYGLKMLNDPDQIQNFIQNIFYYLCKCEDLEFHSNPKVYLLRSMKNAVYNYFHSRQQTCDMDEIAFSVSDDDNSLEAFFSKDDDDVRRYKELVKAIDQLPNQQKQVLYLYYIKELSHNEIAEIMGIIPQSSMNALSKGIRKLRDLLTPELVGVLILIRQYVI